MKTQRLFLIPVMIFAILVMAGCEKQYSDVRVKDVKEIHERVSDWSGTHTRVSLEITMRNYGTITAYNVDAIVSFYYDDFFLYDRIVGFDDLPGKSEQVIVLHTTYSPDDFTHYDVEATWVD